MVKLKNRIRLSQMTIILNNSVHYVLFYGPVSGLVLNPITGEVTAISTIDIVNMAFEVGHN
jgi:hypothetical protein